MAASEAPTSKLGAKSVDRKDEVITILMAICMNNVPAYLKTCADMANILNDAPISKSSMQGWLKPWFDRAKELAAKASEAGGNDGAPATPAKTPAKAKKASETRKRKPASNDKEDDAHTPPAKTIKGRKATPRPKKIKADIVEEDCDLSEGDAENANGVEGDPAADAPAQEAVVVKEEVV